MENDVNEKRIKENDALNGPRACQLWLTRASCPCVCVNYLIKPCVISREIKFCASSKWLRWGTEEMVLQAGTWTRRGTPEQLLAWPVIIVSVTLCFILEAAESYWLSPNWQLLIAVLVWFATKLWWFAQNTEMSNTALCVREAWSCSWGNKCCVLQELSVLMRSMGIAKA